MSTPPVRSNLNRPGQGSASALVDAKREEPTASQAPPPTDKPHLILCELEDDGAAIATIHISAQYMRRIRTKSGGKNMQDQIWLDIFRPALEGYCY